MNTIKSPSLWLAITAQSLFLINLLALPGVALIALLYMAWHYRNSDDHLGSCHLRQAAMLSGWFVVIVIGGGIFLWFTVGEESPAGLSMTLLYLIVMHTSFVLLGMIGLAKALSGKHFHPGRRNSLSH